MGRLERKTKSKPNCALSLKTTQPKKAFPFAIGMPAKLSRSGSRNKLETEAIARTTTTATTTATEAIATPAMTVLETGRSLPSRWRDDPLPPGVSAVRLLWTDFAGIRRCRVIPASRWKSVATGTSPIRLAQACAALQTTVDALTPGASAAGVVGDVSLFPVRRPAVLPWHPSHAVSLCELRKLLEPGDKGMAVSAEVDLEGDDADALLTPECFSLCPRSAARRACVVAERSKPAMALFFGFETEFKLSRRRQGAAAEAGGGGASGGGPPPAPFADPGSYCHSLALDAHSAVLDEIVSSLGGLLAGAGLGGGASPFLFEGARFEGVRVEQWHAEAGSGLGSESAVFELVTSHALLVDAVDALVLTRETISQVARRRGLDAVFLPKPDGASAAGLGCHAHFSVVDGGTGENLTRDVAGKRSERLARAAAARGVGAVTPGEAFVAGVCGRVDALLAFTSCGPTSHLRLQPGCWAGAPSSSPPSSSSSESCSNWGPADKEAPLRVLPDNVEFKPMDATANPYLAAAAIVAAGLEGVAKGEGLPPPRGSCVAAAAAAPVPGTAVAGEEPAAAAAERACMKSLEALRAWKATERGGLSPIFSPEALEALEALRLADLNAMRDWSYEETRERLSLLY